PNESSGNAPGNSMLVGYIVGRTASELTVQSLREMLKDELPEALIPPHLVLLAALPLTANGKIDRKRLPRPGEAEMRLPQGQGDPRSPVEEFLLALWQELLVVPALGIHDSFFALGGHSLLVMRLMGRVQAFFHVAMPVRTLFDEPTV